MADGNIALQHFGALAFQRIVVTGGAGFIGSALVRMLLKETAAQVLVIDKLTYAGGLSSLDDVREKAAFSFEQADICDAARMARILTAFQPDAIMHLAAESHVDRSIDGPAAFVQTNLVGTFTLLNEARRYWAELPPAAAKRFRFLHVSTDEVYGSLKDIGSFDEAAPYRPNSPYAATKAGSDHLARAWHVTFGLPVIVTNCSNNYGPYQFPEKLIPTMIINAMEGRALPIYGAGKNIRDWLYVEDHAAALLAVLNKGRAGETYNIGGGAERRNIDLVRQICTILDEISPRPGAQSYAQLIDFVADRPGHDYRYAIDDGKLRAEIGWQPRMTFDEGLRQTVSWYLERDDWWQSIRSQRYDGRRQGLSLHAGGQTADYAERKQEA